MGAQVGTPRKCLIDGISYFVKADADVTKKPKTEKEGIATSGRTYQKITKVPENIESITLITTPEENRTLEQLSDDGDVIPISFEYADKSIHRTTGFIFTEGRTSAEGVTTVTITAEVEWTLFPS